MNDRKPSDQPLRTECAPTLPPATFAIENIGHMRRAEGIDDERLDKEIARLKIGDIVRLTLRAGARTVECVLVRIVAKHRHEFTGEFETPPTDPQFQRLTDGMTLNFTADHIHSVQKTQSAVVTRIG